jgi:hypothetical protein
VADMFDLVAMASLVSTLSLGLIHIVIVMHYIPSSGNNLQDATADMCVICECILLWLNHHIMHSIMFCILVLL